MKRFLLSALITGLLASFAASAADTKCYEMRVYYAPPGKLDDLNARFRDHTLALFEKHGFENVGYWTPLENPDNKLIYIIASPSREANKASWKAFMADPDWKAAHKKSEENGKLVEKLESHFLTATDYSPVIKTVKGGPRVWELRTYTAAPGKLDALNARFRDHTVGLFAKHGMVNFGYWNKEKDQKDADTMLIYLLAHKSKEAAMESFKNFGQDPAWTKAKTESEANGPLTAKDGVKREFLQATDYSPTK